MQKEESPEGHFSINQRGYPTHQQRQDSLLPAMRQGGKPMKLPRNALIWCVFMVCLTLLIFTYLTRSSLCELRIKDGSREVAALLAYESGK